MRSRRRQRWRPQCSSARHGAAEQGRKHSGGSCVGQRTGRRCRRSQPARRRGERGRRDGGEHGRRGERGRRDGGELGRRGGLRWHGMRRRRRRSQAIGIACEAGSMGPRMWDSPLHGWGFTTRCARQRSGAKGRRSAEQRRPRPRRRRRPLVWHQRRPVASGATLASAARRALSPSPSRNG
jgi:hypothetical protein